MSPQDLFSQLPSLNELVDHPRVQRAVGQWTRSETLSRVRSAVHDLGSEVARRAEDLGAKSPADLLERLVERLDAGRSSSPTEVINASGEPWGGAWAQPRLSDAALDQARLACSAYSPTAATPEVLRELVGSESAAILASHGLALAAAIEAVANERGDIVCAKIDATDPAPGCSLTKLARREEMNLVEVGGPSGATLADYEHALSASPAPRAVLRRYAEFFRVEGGQATPSIEELAALSHRFGASLIVDMGGSAPVELPLDVGVAKSSAQHAIQSGADLVLLNGVGLVGGPQCGLAAGGFKLVESLKNSRTGSLAIADAGVQAAAESTLELFTRPSQLRFAHPVVRSLDTPLENLRTRAERLAPQILAGGLVNAAEPIAIAVDQAVGPIGVVRLPSWGVAIEVSSPEELRKRLLCGDPSVVIRSLAIEDRLVLDLRTVAPADDTLLVSRFTAEG